MKQDKTKTKVKFLIEKEEGNLPCNVFAFFPKSIYSNIPVYEGKMYHNKIVLQGFKDLLCPYRATFILSY